MNNNINKENPEELFHSLPKEKQDQLIKFSKLIQNEEFRKNLEVNPIETINNEGFEVDEKKFAAALQNKNHSQLSSDTELDDNQLENVAGGALPPWLCAFTVFGLVAYVGSVIIDDLGKGKDSKIMQQATKDYDRNKSTNE